MSKQAKVTSTISYDSYVDMLPQPLNSFFAHNSLPREATDIDCGTEMITKQSMAAECDINTILKQYEKTGIINATINNNAAYLDLSTVPDYQEALNIVIQAEEAFSTLSAHTREYYGNDPARFLAALDDPDQHDKLREFGVLKPIPAPEPGPTPPAPPSPEAKTT